MRPVIPIITVLLMSFAAPAFSQDSEWPRETEVEGPTPFCAGGFSIALQEGETVTKRDPGLDFLLFFIEGPQRTIGIYQGNHPDVPGRRETLKLNNGLQVERFKNDDDSWGYLLNVTPEASLPTFLHFFGDAFDETEADKLTFERFLFADFDHLFCVGPASNRY